MSRSTWRQRLRPRALPVRDYFGFNVMLSIVIELVLAAVVTGLAVSRATNHRLSPVATVVLLAAGAVVGATYSTPLAFFSGLSETLGGLVVRDETTDPGPVRGDPFRAIAMWGRAV